MDSPEDLRLLELFYIRCLPTIPGYTRSGIFRIVPQLGSTEPVIRHATLAIASLYEETEALGRPLNENPQTSRDGNMSKSEAVAMRHYTTALYGLQQGIISKTASPTIVLIACMLFACMEALRGQDQAALAHIENGLNIISNLKESREDDPRSGQKSHSLSLDSQLTKPLSSAFSRLQLLVLAIKERNLPGKFKIESLGPLKDCPPKWTFSTLAEARTALEPVLNNAANVIYSAPQAGHPAAASPGPDPAVTRRIQVDAQIKHWSRAFDAFMTEALSQSHANDSPVIEHLKTYPLILRTCAKLVSIGLWVSYLPEGGPSLEAMNPDFEELLDLVERCTISQSQGQVSIPGNKFRPPLFIMDMGVIPAMFFTACKCPSIVLRRRAIEMLERNPRREALWDSTRSARDARNLMEMETNRIISS